MVFRSLPKMLENCVQVFPAKLIWFNFLGIVQVFPENMYLDLNGIHKGNPQYIFSIINDPMMCFE